MRPTRMRHAPLFQEAFFRLAPMSAGAALSQSSVHFDWPSQEALTGYFGDRDAPRASKSWTQIYVLEISRTRRIATRSADIAFLHLKG